MNRRNFMAVAMAAVASTAVNATVPVLTARRSIKAIAFDGLALFDPHPVFALVGSFSPGNSGAFVSAWRDKLFEYTWLRTLTGVYADFQQVTDNALLFAADAAGI